MLERNIEKLSINTLEEEKEGPVEEIKNAIPPNIDPQYMQIYVGGSNLGFSDSPNKLVGLSESKDNGQRPIDSARGLVIQKENLSPIKRESENGKKIIEFSKEEGGYKVNTPYIVEKKSPNKSVPKQITFLDILAKLNTESYEEQRKILTKFFRNF